MRISDWSSDVCSSDLDVRRDLIWVERFDGGADLDLASAVGDGTGLVVMAVHAVAVVVHGGHVTRGRLVVIVAAGGEQRGAGEQQGGDGEGAAAHGGRVLSGSGWGVRWWRCRR